VVRAVWSLGCVAAELILGRPLFPGRDCVEQLVEIFQVLGTPTRDEIESMNRSYTDFRFTTVQRRPWSSTFPASAPADLIDLIAKLLAYSPSVRITPLHVCIQPTFDVLRQSSTRLPNGAALPPLFNFTETELGIEPALNAKLTAGAR